MKRRSRKLSEVDPELAVSHAVSGVLAQHGVYSLAHTHLPDTEIRTLEILDRPRSGTEVHNAPCDSGEILRLEEVWRVE